VERHGDTGTGIERGGARAHCALGAIADGTRMAGRARAAGPRGPHGPPGIGQRRRPAPERGDGPYLAQALPPGGIDGVQDAPRSGRPATYTPEQVGEVIAAARTKPQDRGLPCGAWTLDRREAYLNDARKLPIKRSRSDELLIAEGVRWRTQATWVGERAALAAAADQPAAPLPNQDRA
jgi:transposase